MSLRKLQMTGSQCMEFQAPLALAPHHQELEVESPDPQSYVDFPAFLLP